MVRANGTSHGGEAARSRFLQLPVVPARALKPFESLEEAKRLAQLEADGALVTQLALQNFEGSEWLMFVRALAEYGHAVVSSWIRRGVIFLRCAQKGLGLAHFDSLPGPIRRALVQEASGLANETITLAITAFREKVLIPHRWDPAKGASLRTFFIGQAIFQFPNVHRAWVKTVDCHGADDHDIIEEWTPGRCRPDRAAELGRELERLDRVPLAEPGRLAALAEFGFEQRAIGKDAGLSRKAVERKLARHRGETDDETK
jgi:hypothetical protein